MSLAECKRELQEVLNKELRECHVVVLPDFFLDRIINLQWDPAEFSSLISQVAQRKGGSIDGVPQMDLKGGNAINMASALSRLDVKVTPITCTSELGLQQIKYHFKDTRIDLSHVKICNNPSITTAMEFRSQDGKTNVMLRDLGDLANFGPSDLDESHYKLIDEADYTCLFNWAGTLKYGTALAQAVFGRAKQSNRCKTFYDTADPTPNAESIPDLIEKVLKTSKIDILSLNENEAVTYASQLDEGLKEKRSQLGSEELAMEAARTLAKNFSARIDLHTTSFSASFVGKKEVVTPAYKVKALRATGAGDAWNAGNIFADNNGLSDECRLLLANAVSACYLSDASGMHPTKAKLARFLKTSM
jgi:sugar/nucleoside kinase (ribokinase family)